MINPKRINEIIKSLDKADDAYYNDAISIMTDQQYDDLKDELRKLSPNHPRLSKVGHQRKVSEWKEAKHKIAMTSLNKVNVVDEFVKWTSEIGDEYYLMEDKLDGFSLDLEYEQGILVRAITRGDGEVGDDILSNVKKMKNVKIDLGVKIDLSIRGEGFILAEDFEKIQEILRKNGTPELSNPRNAATGIAKRFDGNFSEYVTAYYYDIASNELDFTEEVQKMEYLKKLGLKVCMYKKVNVKQAIELYQQYEDKLRTETPYDIDGLVVKANKLEIQEKHGLLGKRPKAQIAWKFTSMKKETSAEEVEWSNGRNRRITPIANVAEVLIGGVRVSRASLHNLDIFKKLELGKGDTVLIARRNDVIPYLEEVIKHKGPKFEIPTKCPTCKADLEIEGKFLICPNDACSALTIGNLTRWIGGLDIMNIGESIIEKLHESGKLNEPADFYKLKVSDIAILEGLGEKTANKVLKHLAEKMELTLPEFLGNLNMSNFSNSRVEMLVEAGYDTMEKILNVRENDLVKIKGIESKTAGRIVDGLKSKKLVIENLLKVGIKIKAIVKKQIKSNKLQGKSFCFTGGINKVDENGKRFTREMMEEIVVENSGTIESVKKGLSYLVQADPNSVSSKSQKAKELGIAILSEEKFFQMVG